MTMLNADDRRDPAASSSLSDTDGFTIIEMLVVLGIIGLLGALVGPRVLSYFGKAKADTAQVQIENIVSALQLYRLDVGHYPDAEDGLLALVEAPADAKGWRGPYLRKKGGLVDPWSRSYQYRVPGRTGDFEIFSFGRDGVEAGDGEDRDIVSW